MLIPKIIITFGLLITNTVRTKEESPAAVSKGNTNSEKITVLQERVNHSDDSPTIKIEISKETSRNVDNKISKTDTDSNDGSRSTKDDNQDSALTEVSVHMVNTQKDDDSVFQESSGKRNKSTDSSKQDEKAVEHSTNSSNDIDQDESRLHEEAELGSGEFNGSNDAQPQFEESEGRSMQDIMLNNKGRNGNTFEDKRPVSTADIRSIDEFKLLNNPVLHRGLSDIIIPQYYKELSRRMYPYSAGMYNYPSISPPYFGTLPSANPVHSRKSEVDFLNTRRIASNTESQPEAKLRQLEDYTDLNSNAYPYTPDGKENLITVPNPQMINMQQKYFGANQQILPQLNPYSNENYSPLHYAGNFPYGVNTRFRRNL